MKSEVQERKSERLGASLADSMSSFISCSLFDFSAGKARPWPANEKKVLTTTFRKHLKKHTLPGKEEILQLMRENPSKFQGRSWKNIKDCVRNISNSMKLPKP